MCTHWLTHWFWYWGSRLGKNWLILNMVSTIPLPSFSIHITSCEEAQLRWDRWKTHYKQTKTFRGHWLCVLKFYANNIFHNFSTYHCFEAKDDLHVFDGSHKPGQKSVSLFQKVQDFLKVLYVSVPHNRIDFGRQNTQPPRILKAQRLGIHFWPRWGVHTCSEKNE